MKHNDFAGMHALVMGLGLNGGGVESARYLASRGAEVTVTDLRDETVLAPSIAKLRGLRIRYVLRTHKMEDFRGADMVIKNPGVRLDSPFLAAAKRIETDISLFLAASPARLIAVTGSKGKSSVATALHWTLDRARMGAGERRLRGKARLGGNITVSPLTFLDELEPDDDVVLELSSWQLGDIRGRGLLKPRAAVITPIMPDHLDRYGTMEAYVSDKRLIYENQDRSGVTVVRDDEWGRSFLRESRGRPLVYSEKPLDEGTAGGWVSAPDGPAFARLWDIPTDNSRAGGGAGGVRADGQRIAEIVPARLLVPGSHQKQNLLAASLALLDLGLDADFVRKSLGAFPGIEHRLEFFHESSGVRFYNDSAATIPEAAAAAVRAFEKPPVLVTGGTDKELDFSPLALAAANAKAVILLEGTGSLKLKALLDSGGVKYQGPFDSLDAAIGAALQAAAPGDSVILSPGCASFGMFLNEFDRGRKWKDAVRNTAP